MISLPWVSQISSLLPPTFQSRPWSLPPFWLPQVPGAGSLLLSPPWASELHSPHLWEIPVVQGHDGRDVALQKGIDEVTVELDSFLIHLVS